MLNFKQKKYFLVFSSTWVDLKEKSMSINNPLDNPPLKKDAKFFNLPNKERGLYYDSSLYISELAH